MTLITNQDIDNKLYNLTDIEFMRMQVWQLKSIFNDEIVSIKNISHQFVAFTEKFAQIFK